MALFRRHRLGQIARLIDVRAQHDGGVIGHELHRDVIDQRPWAASAPGASVTRIIDTAGRHFLHVLQGFGRIGRPSSCMISPKSVIEPCLSSPALGIDVGDFRDSLSASSSAGASVRGRERPQATAIANTADALHRARSAANCTAGPPRRPTARSTSTPHCLEPRDRGS